MSAEELLAEDEERTDGDAQATEKLHLRVLPCDRNLFKKLRSHDLEGHFSAYGASYVEWLGEQSANVWFPDADNAARAKLALAAEIPAPFGDVDLTNWRLARIEKDQGRQVGQARHRS